MRVHKSPKVFLVVILCWLPFAWATPVTAQPAGRDWIEQWKAQNKSWRALHLIGPRPEKLEVTKELISEVLAPMGINVLILEVNYGFRYESHPELQCRGLDRKHARELTAFCRKHGIRLIPLFNCLGHQSWARNTSCSRPLSP